MKWEYRAVCLLDVSFNKGVDLTKILNIYGNHGWELILADLKQNYFVFKRSKPLVIKAQELSEDDAIAMRKVIEDWRKID